MKKITRSKYHTENLIYKYNTIYLLVDQQFEELEIDKDVIIEIKEFDD